MDEEWKKPETYEVMAKTLAVIINTLTNVAKAFPKKKGKKPDQNIKYEDFQQIVFLLAKSVQQLATLDLITWQTMENTANGSPEDFVRDIAKLWHPTMMDLTKDLNTLAHLQAAQFEKHTPPKKKTGRKRKSRPPRK